MAKLFQPLVPAPHLPLADAQNLGRLPSGNLLRYGP
jgi:hypothetical protein